MAYTSHYLVSGLQTFHLLLFPRFTISSYTDWLTIATLCY
ncbi:Uncharacterised protein [Klebsiella variicola]|nr:Uncharacterised protein [Klebsiella variicola]